MRNSGYNIQLHKEENLKMIYLLLYIEFFKIGLFAVGGGLATLPFLYQLSLKTGWFTTHQLADMVAVSEITPGPLGINMATFSGFNAGGILGGIVATLGIVTPSVIVIIIVAGILNKFIKNKYVADAFTGLRPAVCALITIAVWEIAKVSVFDFELYEQTSSIKDLFLLKNILFMIILFVLMRKIRLHPIVYIGLSAVAGIFINF